MNLFQIIALPIIGILFIFSLIMLVRGNQSRSIALLGVLIWLVAGIAILWPELTIQVARMMGIGRGADLLLYILVICYLISMFYIYIRFRKLESNITEIVRQLAIRDAVDTEKISKSQDMARNTPGDNKSVN